MIEVGDVETMVREDPVASLRAVVAGPRDALLPEGSHAGQRSEAFGWVDGYGESPPTWAGP